MIICKKDNPSPCPLISSVILEKSPERPAPSIKLPSPLPQHASPTTHHPPLTDTTRRRAMIDWRFSGAALLFPQPDENCGIADAGTPHLLRTPLRVTSACSAACRPGRPHYHIHNASGYRFLNATPVPLFAFFFSPPALVQHVAAASPLSATCWGRCDGGGRCRWLTSPRVKRANWPN